MKPLVTLPARPAAGLILAHGAGAGMRHTFMEAIANRLGDHSVATFRYEFAYMAAGRRRPDVAAALIDRVREAIDAAAEYLPDLPLFAGGKSMGGRMTSMALAAQPDPRVRGVVFFGFPLHPAKKPSITRAAHLSDVTQPMLFLQGTRDALADLDLLNPICADLPGSTLHVVEGADHGFHVLKRSGRTDEDVLDELVRTAAEWCMTHTET